jgi:DNA-binding transcriptional LysR family regulator
MDLWQLHIFRKVVELASFSKAGESIHLSQPTVSSHIKDLEKHFGCPLIDRLSRCAVPTKAGELLYSNATRILAMRDEIENIMAEYQGQYRGGLRIGASTIPGGYLLPKIIGGFNRDYPNIQISLLIGDSKEIVQKVLAGDIEIGFVGAHYESPHLHETAFTNDELKLVVYPEHPWADKLSVEIEALCQEPMIVREAGSGSLHVLTSALKNKGLNLEKRLSYCCRNREYGRHYRRY